MSRSAQFGRNLLLALILSVFVLPVANASLVEVYINKSEELTTSETDFIIESGTDIVLKIHLNGDIRIDSDNTDLAVETIYIDVYFDNDDDRRDSTSGSPIYKEAKGEIRDYDLFESRFLGDDTRFKDYEGQIRFSIIFKNSSGELIKGVDKTILITMEAPSNDEGISSGINIGEMVNDVFGNELFFPIVGGLFGLLIVSLLVYKFVLAPEDTTADIYRQKESVDPLKKSLTGVGYESELPSESKLKRLEDKDSDDEEEEEEDDDGEYEYDDDEDDDEEFDERAMLDKLTGTQTLNDTSDSDDEDDEKLAPKPKKKAVKKKVAIKKTVAKKKVVRKAAPAQKKAPESEVNMGKGVTNISCPSCEKVHHVEENTTKFICSCGRRIRV